MVDLARQTVVRRIVVLAATCAFVGRLAGRRDRSNGHEADIIPRKPSNAVLVSMFGVARQAFHKLL